MSIRLEEVTVRLRDKDVLKNVTLALDQPRIGIIGPNGSGKSTFARLLNGLVLPHCGQVLVHGRDTRRHGREIRRRVGFVFQNPENQIVFPVVSEDIAFGLKNLGIRKCDIAAQVTRELERFDILHLADRPSHDLSGGEKQIVALAAVLAMRPDIVVFDEPTTLLDLRNRNRIRGAIAALPQAAVVVTHDLDLLADFDRVLVIDGGQVVVDDTPPAAVRWYREHLS